MRVDAAMTHWSSKIIVPIRRVDVDVRQDVQVEFYVFDVVVVWMVFPIAPSVVHDRDFFKHLGRHDGRWIFFYA